MSVVLVAGYPWWSLSDPLITLVKYLKRRGIPCRLAGLRLLPFLAGAYPSEPEFTSLPLHLADRLGDLGAAAVSAVDAAGPGATVLFLDEKALVAAREAANRAGRTLLYATELPPDGTQPDPLLVQALERLDGLLIQDGDRLEAFRGFYGPRPETAWLLPNVCLSEADYGESEPPDLGFLAERRFILLAGSLIPEHAVLEMARAFLAAPGDCLLLVNGWGDQVREQLETLFAGRDEALLSTRYLSGPEVRWLMARCWAGVVSYSNSTVNHRLCGQSSGKLFWLARFAKPVLYNDNASIVRLAATHGFGIQAGADLGLDRLARDYPRLSAASLAFHRAASRRAGQVLAEIFPGQPCAS